MTFLKILRAEGVDILCDQNDLYIRIYCILERTVTIKPKLGYGRESVMELNMENDFEHKMCH